MDQDVLKKVENIEKRLSLIERHLGIKVAEVETSAGVAPVAGISVNAEAARVVEVKSQTPALPAQVKAKIRSAGELESYIGRWWLGIVGIVAILFGAGFFLKYAFENNLIPPGGRILIEVLAGLLFIVAGEFVRRKLPKYSYILSGAGLSLFYLAVYGSFWFYHLIDAPVAFGFMAAVTLFGITLAIFINGMELAGLAIAGGFLTPFLLSTGQAQDLNLFSYLLVLNLAVLVVAFFKSWQSLNLLGFVGLVFNFISWYASYYSDEKLWFTVYWLGLFFVMYAFAAVVANVVAKKLSGSRDLFVLSINPVWFSLWVYFLLEPKYEDYLGFLAAAVGAFYIFLAYLASALHRDDKKLTLFLGAIALLFLTVAVPLQLEQNVITIAWAFEVAILFVLGVFLKTEKMRWFAMGVLLMAVGRLFFFDSGVDLKDFIPVFNRRFFGYFTVIVASGIITYLATAKKEVFRKEEQGLHLATATLLNILIVVAVTLEISSFFAARVDKLERYAVEEYKRTVPVDQQYGSYYYESEGRYRFRSTPEYRSSVNQRNAAISVFWALYAVFLMILGMAIKNSLIRWSALIFFGITIGKVFLYDLSMLKTPYRIISFTVLGFILLGASYLYFRYQKSLEGQKENAI